MATLSSPQAERLSVAVIGLGAIGGVAAGCLAGTGRYDLVACVRQPIERLTLDAPDGTVTLPLHALTDPAQANPVDWVLLCTKTHATASTAPWLKAAVHAVNPRGGAAERRRPRCPRRAVRRCRDRAAGDRLLQRRTAWRRPRAAAALARIRMSSSPTTMPAAPLRNCSKARRCACNSVTISPRWRGASS